MTVWKILEKKGDVNVASVGPEEALAVAIHTMCEKRIGCLMVQDAEGKPLGILSERDCLREIDRDRQAFAVRTAADAMTRDVICALPTDSAHYAMQVMTNHRIRHLPVVDKGKVVGLISIGDVINYQLQESLQKNRKMHDYLELSGQL